MSSATMPRRGATSAPAHAAWLPRALLSPLGYLEALRADERPVVPFKLLGGRRAHLVTEPELIAAVLDRADAPAARGPRYLETLFPPRRPRLPEPAGLAELAAARARRRAATWVEGQPLEMLAELRSLCLEIAWEALTGAEAPRGLAAALAPSRPFRHPRHEGLDAALGAMVEERRGRDAGDLLSVLVSEGGSDEQLVARARDWLAGDRTHAALAWTMWLLAQHGDVEARWHATLDGASTERLVTEALRLYPPVWAFLETAPESLPLGGAPVPKGDLVAVSPWLTQRDPRVWPDPERFDLDRWDAPAADGAYFPFAGVDDGERALRHAARIMAALGEHWAYRQSEGELEPAAGWALEPRGGARFKPVPRP